MGSSSHIAAQAERFAQALGSHSLFQPRHLQARHDVQRQLQDALEQAARTGETRVTLDIARRFPDGVAQELWQALSSLGEQQDAVHYPYAHERQSNFPEIEVSWLQAAYVFILHHRTLAERLAQVEGYAGLALHEAGQAALSVPAMWFGGEKQAVGESAEKSAVSGLLAWEALTRPTDWQQAADATLAAVSHASQRQPMLSGEGIPSR